MVSVCCFRATSRPRSRSRIVESRMLFSASSRPLLLRMALLLRLRTKRSSRRDAPQTLVKDGRFARRKKSAAPDRARRFPWNYRLEGTAVRAVSAARSGAGLIVWLIAERALTLAGKVRFAGLAAFAILQIFAAIVALRANEALVLLA